MGTLRFAHPTGSNSWHASVLRLGRIAAHAGLDKTLPRLTDDLLIDRLLQAIEPRLRQAELELIALVLPFQARRRGKACHALGGGNRHGGGRSGGSRRGCLSKGGQNRQTYEAGGKKRGPQFHLTSPGSSSLDRSLAMNAG
ncbi:hypothetical protein [Bradyrhizobium frederickii]|uniref:hypothetical protein n=1 Tax=Bradyrhizobium frederickii TaxID=2560054 RepID=UPI0014300B2E